MTALYSDVVASRPPSPRRERCVEVAQETGSNHLNSEIRVDENNNPIPKIIESTSVNKGDTPEIDVKEEPALPYIIRNGAQQILQL